MLSTRRALLAPRLAFAAMSLMLAACADTGGDEHDTGTDDGIPPECLENSDMDCDGDYLSNGLEESLGLDPSSPDSDGDGTNDIAEIAICCEGMDLHDPACAESLASADCHLDLDEFYVELPFESDETRDLTFGTDLQMADVYFLVDTTGSMEGEIENLKASLDALASALREEIPDVGFGVGHFEDFPVSICEGETSPCYGRTGDLPYRHLLSVTTDMPTAHDGVNRLAVPHPNSGLDLPESQVEALYQIATAEGLAPFIDPPGGCLEGAFGWPCFRRESLPIIVLCTDASMHNGPTDGTDDPYDDAALSSALGVARSHTWPDAIAAVSAISAKVLGLWSADQEDLLYDPETREDLVETAEATGAVSPDPTVGALVFDINPDGTGIGDAVVEAVAALAHQVPIDVNAVWEENPGIDDGVDARGFIGRITPISATPADAIEGIAGDIFLGVEPGTRLDFEVLFQNHFVEELVGVPMIFVLRIVIMGDATARLDELRVVVLVPPGSILI